jgi:hypothetical protein
MKIKLANGRAASSNDIAALETKIGEPLVQDFVDFISKNDGAKPQENIFQIGATNDAGIDGFIPMRKIPSEMLCVECLPKRAYPVAWASGGNYVFINQAEDGAVYFWDHERPESPIKIAENFRSFLSAIEPFDIASVKLKPGQVKKAWIDPDFLKSLK